MTRYEEFCQSLAVGQAKREAEQVLGDEHRRALPEAVGKVLRSMCDSFGCPPDRVRYIDVRTGVTTAAARPGAPLEFDAEKGRYCIDLEIEVNAGASESHPVWLHFECAPLKHGGFELHFGSAIFQAPNEMVEALHKHVASAINHALRSKTAPGPTRVGYGPA